MDNNDGDEKLGQIDIDVEQIMREIRLEILMAHDSSLKVPGLSQLFEGDRFQPDFYDHIYQASLAFDVSDIKIQLTPSRLPFFGSIWQNFRKLWHEIALVYVRPIAEKQSVINEALLTAVVELTENYDNKIDGLRRPEDL